MNRQILNPDSNPILARQKAVSQAWIKGALDDATFRELQNITQVTPEQLSLGHEICRDLEAKLPAWVTMDLPPPKRPSPQVRKLTAQVKHARVAVSAMAWERACEQAVLAAEKACELGLIRQSTVDRLKNGPCLATLIGLKTKQMFLAGIASPAEKRAMRELVEPVKKAVRHLFKHPPSV